MSLFISFFVPYQKGSKGSLGGAQGHQKDAQGEPRGTQKGAPEAPLVPKKSSGGSVQGTVAGRLQAIGYSLRYAELDPYVHK